jgi:cytochrome c553
MRWSLSFFALCIGVLGTHATWAGDPDAAKAKATGICAGCHGPKGISASGMFPNLAGQRKEYLAKQLKAFRDKTRIDPNMNSMAAGLKDEEIADLAAHFSSLKPCE